jgi:Ni,Fe-hydrogenase I large subunit
MSRDHSSVSIHFLVKEIWSKIRQQLPEAQLHIYSSSLWKNAPAKQELEKNNVFIKGYAEDLEIIQRYRVMLYPAVYSVGLKSKVVESWLHHTPVVTTPVGAEGMFFEALEARYAVSQAEHDSGFVSEREFTKEELEGEKKLKSYYNSNTLSSQNSKGLQFGGSFRNYSFEEFAQSAVELYTKADKWSDALSIGQKTVLKNQSEIQLEINIKQVLAGLELAAYNARGHKAYEEEWKRFIKTKEYEKKVYPYPPTG